MKIILLLVAAILVLRMFAKRRPRTERARFRDVLAGRDDRVRPTVVLAGAALVAAGVAAPGLWRSVGGAGRVDILDQLVTIATIGAAAGGIYLLGLSAIAAWRGRSRRRGSK